MHAVLAVAAALAAVQCGRVVRRLGPSSRAGWRLIAAGLAMWSFGEACLVASTEYAALWSLGGAARLCASLLMAVGISNVPRSVKWSGVRSVMDGATVATSLGYVAWAIFFVEAPSSPASPGIVGTAIDVFVLAAALMSLGRAAPPRRGSAWLFGGAFFHVLGNAVFGGLLSNVAQPRPLLGALSWGCWLGVIVVAAHRTSGRDDDLPAAPEASLHELAPYAAVVAAIVTHVWSGLAGRSLGGWGLAFIVTIVALIIARQLLAVLENQALTAGLRRRVDELQRLSDRLREGQELHDAVLRGLPGGAYTLLVAPTRKRTFISEGLAEMTGYSVEELFEQGETNLIDPRDVERVAGEYERAVAEGSATFRYRITDRHGRQRWVENRVRAATDGAHVALNGFVADVTDEIEAARREEERRRMDAVGRFASVVAHDLNNILTALQAYTRFARQAASTGGSVESDLDEIDRATARAAALASQLVAVASPVAELADAEALDIRATLQVMAPMLSVLMGSVSLQVEQSDVGPPPIVMIHSEEFERVVLNLCRNARDACLASDRKDPSVVVGVSEERHSSPESSGGIGSSASESYVSLVVIDNGVGMDPMLQEICLEPFVTTKADGGGLGLASVAAIVRKAGGTITVESRPGIGSRFTVRLPVLSP